MSSFGLGVYFLTVIWFVALMLCFVSVKTGHHIGQLAVGLAVSLTVILVVLPKEEEIDSDSANFYDPVYVTRYATLLLLVLCALAGLGFYFATVWLAPIETRKVRSFGSVN